MCSINHSQGNRESENWRHAVFALFLTFYCYFAFLCNMTPQKGPSPGELVEACLGPSATGDVSGAKFHAALQEIYTQNGLVDRDFADRLVNRCINECQLCDLLLYFKICCVTIKYLLVLHITSTPRPLLKDEP